MHAVLAIHDLLAERLPKPLNRGGHVGVDGVHATGESTVDPSPAGRIGWLRPRPDAPWYLMREVDGGWSEDPTDEPGWRTENYPDAVFTPIYDPATEVIVNRSDLESVFNEYEVEWSDAWERIREALTAGVDR